MFVHNNSSQGKCEWHVSGPHPREEMESLTRVIKRQEAGKYEGDFI